MKKAKFMKWIRLAVILCFTISVCLAAPGCRSAGTDNPDSLISKPTSSIISEDTISTGPNPDLSSNAQQDTASDLVIAGQEPEGQQLAVYGTGKVRIRYAGNVSSAAYITSADCLPDYEELEKYDEAYFEDNALLLVTESVPSGSIDIKIDSIVMNDSIATVTLYHGAPENGTYSTDDMATWLLWAEVPADLDCRWSVANPALESESAAY